MANGELRMAMLLLGGYAGAGRSCAPNVTAGADDDGAGPRKGAPSPQGAYMHATPLTASTHVFNDGWRAASTGTYYFYIPRVAKTKHNNNNTNTNNKKAWWLKETPYSEPNGESQGLLLCSWFFKGNVITSSLITTLLLCFVFATRRTMPDRNPGRVGKHRRRQYCKRRWGRGLDGLDGLDGAELRTPPSGTPKFLAQTSVHPHTAITLKGHPR